MIITCPSCSARYPVDASAFPPSGRKVRCAKCGNSWHQAAPADLPHKIDLTETPPAAAPAPLQPQPQPSAPIFKKPAPALEPEPEPVAKQDAPLSAVPAEETVPEESPEKIIVEHTTVTPIVPSFEEEPDVDIVFAPTPAPVAVAATVTGGRLRAYLDNVASMRRGRVLNAAGWAALAIFVSTSLYGVFHYRSQIASLWPVTAKFYAATGKPINLRGIEFHNVAYERQNENGLPVLAVKGDIVNVSGDARVLPRLRVGLTDAQDHELYHWTFALPEKELAAQKSASFTTRLSSPPVEARNIEVRFVIKSEEVPADKAGSVSNSQAGTLQAGAESITTSY